MAAFEEGRHNLIKRAHLHEVVGVRRQRDVDAVPRALSRAALVGGARTGKERPAQPRDDSELVQGDREHLVGVVERGLHAVAVVRIDVHIRDLHPAVREEAAHDRGVVIDAEARCVAPHRVMQPARTVERDPRATRDHVLHRDERRARCEQRSLVHAGEGWSVAPRGETPRGVVTVGHGRGLGDRVHVRGVVDALELAARRVPRRQNTRVR